MKIKGWDNVYGFNMSAVRRLVISEPLVDVVEPHQIVTNYYKIKDVDLYTVSYDDLTFESDFKLIAKRGDHIHALLTFFSIEFTKSLKSIGFSTCKLYRLFITLLIGRMISTTFQFRTISDCLFGK